LTEIAASAFLVGLLGGVHCVAMCGGIVGALNLHRRDVEPLRLGPGGTAVAMFSTQAPLHLSYSAGRIASYAAAGAIAGGVGGTAALLDAVLPAQVVLAVAANACGAARPLLAGLGGLYPAPSAWARRCGAGSRRLVAGGCRSTPFRARSAWARCGAGCRAGWSTACWRWRWSAAAQPKGRS
jgi:sulfite exporter TauE/SafE